MFRHFYELAILYYYCMILAFYKIAIFDKYFDIEYFKYFGFDSDLRARPSGMFDYIVPPPGQDIEFLLNLNKGSKELGRLVGKFGLL